MTKQNLVFVTYDGILNSVFAGQVIRPLLSVIKNNPDTKVHLVCFEKEILSQSQINHLIPNNANINLIQLKRYPVLHKLTLLHSVYLLKKFLKTLPSYSIKARGPFSGWICLKAIDRKKCTNFVVQARSLVAVEYEMLVSFKSKLDNLIHNYRRNLFEKIEKEAYAPKNQPSNFYIESITHELSQYLIKNYFALEQCINIADQDFPEIISDDQKVKWKSDVRKYLKLSDTTHIYCYNGSAKPWQAIDLTIKFFKKKLQKDSNIFLLVLTQDVSTFEYLISLEKIESIYYKVIKIKHEEIYKYLAACDSGLLFRKPHLANWISRPVKAMEYKAAGLNIIHNNTVKWLIDQYK